MNTFITTNNNGDFQAEGLLPGKYRAFLMQEPNSGLRVEASEFEILDHDVTGITIKVSKGAGLSGVVVLENEDRALHVKLRDLQISASVQGPPGVSGMGQSASSRISADGSFNISGLPPGSANFNVYGRYGADQRWTICRIERDGVIQGPRIEVKEGEQIAGVRVVLTYGTATLRGIVTFANGEPIKGSFTSVRLSRSGDTINRSFRTSQVDARGHFVAEGVPAGIYELIVTYNAPNTKPRLQRQQVTLQDNTTTGVTVTLDMSVLPQP
jgi:hypothetical protein